MLCHLALNDEGFVFDPTTGDSFQVNPTGLRILKALREGSEPAEVARALSETYGIAIAEAERDVEDFRERLRSLGLA
jgi:PqqD family protein of HPr-rel-A system